MTLHPELGDAVTFLLQGFGVVLATLLSLAIICGMAGFLFRSYPILALAGAESLAKPKRKTVPASAVDPQLLSVIGTAVDQTLGGRYRIKSVTPLGKN